MDFEVRCGEIFALLGSNGAGKTTTVNILLTLMKPDGGEAGICGFDIQRQPDHVRQSISLTGQFAALDSMLTGRENLMMIAKLRGVSNPAQVADHLLARFSLTDAAGRRVDKYSGGMKRRIDIAMSLIGAPAVILGKATIRWDQLQKCILFSANHHFSAIEMQKFISFRAIR